MGTIVRSIVESRCLRGNPLGDPPAREVVAYLPPGYEEGRAGAAGSGAPRYPVIYVLTGFTGRGVMLLNRAPFAEALDERLDRLIGEGALPPAIVIMPDCFTRYGGSQYLDSSATGPYETYLIEELVPWVDARFRTRAGPEGRAVMGKSSGGYGAIVLGMRHPGVFGAVACHSGDMAFEYCYLPDFPLALIQLEKHGGLAGFLEAFDRLPKRPHEMWGALNVVAMAAAYSPRGPEAPGEFDLPFDERTGAVREEVWRRWLAWDPVRMLDGHAGALRRLALFFDCGTQDEYRLYAGARAFTGRLAELGIAHAYEEFPDTHRDITYRYDRSLRFLGDWLGR